MTGHLDTWAGRVAKWLGTAILLFVMFVSISMCGGYACRSPSTPTTQVPTPTRPTWTPETASGPTNTRTPRPPTRTPTPEVVTYVVQKGDTLYSIARNFNVTVEDLAAWNNIKNPSLIYTGQVLIIKLSTNTPRPPPPTWMLTPTTRPSPTPTKSSRCPSGCITPPPGCDIKGNISFNTGEKIYHVPGQEYYDETIIRHEYGERWFCTEQEAIANGWRKSKR